MVLKHAGSLLVSIHWNNVVLKLGQRKTALFQYIVFAGNVGFTVSPVTRPLPTGKLSPIRQACVCYLAGTGGSSGRALAALNDRLGMGRGVADPLRSPHPCVIHCSLTTTLLPFPTQNIVSLLFPGSANLSPRQLETEYGFVILSNTGVWHWQHVLLHKGVMITSKIQMYALMTKKKDNNYYTKYF